MFLERKGVECLWTKSSLCEKHCIWWGVVCSDDATGCEGYEHDDHDSHGQKSSISMKVMDF
jgi:hypothetical protein